MLIVYVLIFFFKQKTAYEMRISDWSSDVCSSDLPDSAPGSSTGADFEFGITIREADGGALVFSWNPNGTVDGAIVGGTENADGANLNQEISRLLPGQTIVDTGLDRKSTRLNSSH